MSVYKHNYRAYTGKVTPLWSRVTVLARFAFAEAWSSKITVALYTLSLLPLAQLEVAWDHLGGEERVFRHRAIFHRVSDDFFLAHASGELFPAGSA